MGASWKIGQVARQTGHSTRTIRYYELEGLLPRPTRTEAGYRLYSDDDVQRLEFIRKAKVLGFALEDIRGVLSLHADNRPPCVHVLALLDQKVAFLDSLINSLQEFRGELARLSGETREQLAKTPLSGRICGIIERGIHAKGQQAITWLEGLGKATARSSTLATSAKKDPRQ